MIASTTMRAAATCALLATTCLSTFFVSPALAQNTDIPSAYKNIDENGVDLTDGSFNFSLVEGSIGSGEGLLSLIRYDADGSSLDNWEGLALHVEDGTVTVLLGNRSEAFADNGTGFVSEQGNGATLTGSGNSFTYRNADGTQIMFGKADGQTDPCASNANCSLVALSVQEPGGKTVSLKWQALGANVRLTRVSNNFRYAMDVAYLEGGIVNGQATPDWHKRATVTFRNDTVFSGPTPTTRYAYPSANVTEVTTTGERKWRITTDTQGRVVGVKRPGAADDSTQVEYGANGVGKVTHEGVVTTYVRSVDGNVARTEVSDALGRRLTIWSNIATGRPTSVVDALSGLTSYSYDSNDRLTQVTAPERNKVIIEYDARGNVTKRTLKPKPLPDSTPDTTTPDIVTEAGFAAECVNALTCNQPIWTRDAGGAQTDFTYADSTGQMLTATAPAPVANGIRPQTRYTYTPIPARDGSTVSVLSAVSACQTRSECLDTPDEVRTVIEYNAENLQPNAIGTGAGDDPLIARTRMRYDLIGNLTHVDGPLAGIFDTTRTFYNAAREIVGVIGPDPDGPDQNGTASLKHRAQTLIRNADGDVVVVLTGTANGQADSDLAGMSAFEAVHTGYDGNRRAVHQSRDEGSVVTGAVSQSYDARGRPECTAVRMDPTRFATPTSACEPQAPVGPYGPDRVTKTLYDALDRPIQRRVAVGTAEETAEVSAFYTGNDQLQKLWDANDNVTFYMYDPHDRLSRTLYPTQTVGANASNTNDFEQLTYDARSLVTQTRLRDGRTIDLGYDALGRLISKSAPGTAFYERASTYAYDNLGRLTGATNPGELAIAFTYDALGRKVSEGSNWYDTTRSEYDLAGRRTRLTWRDGFAVDYRYLVTGEMADIKEANGTPLATFAYDDRGRRTSLTRGNGTVTRYAYDLGSRMSVLGHDLAGPTYDTQLAFGYNPASQIVDNTRPNDLYNMAPAATDALSSVNGLNQLTDVGGTTLTHDARGNLATMTRPPGKTSPDSGINRSYGYTTENRLARYGVGGGQVVDLAYDPLGRLIHLTTSATDFRYDGSEIIEESEAHTGAPRKRFVHGPGVDEPLVVYDASGAKRWFHADERGSIIATSDASGNAATLHRYDEYGQPQDALGDRFGYTGQMWLPEVGVYSYKARMYDPGLGRFLQSDPIGYAGGPNLYAYVGGDPVNFTDPSGLQNCDGAWLNGDGECKVTGKRLHDRQFVDFGGRGSGFGSFGASSPGSGGPGGRGPGVGRGPAPQPQPRMPVVRRGLLDGARDVYCRLPSLGLSGSLRAYDLLGGGAVLDIAFDPQSGRVGITAGFDVGVGFGGEAGAISSGSNGTAGRGVPNGFSGSVGINTNFRLASIAGGASRTIIGRNGPGFGGASFGVRPGGTGATVNANIGARAGYGGQVLPACK